MEYINRIEIQGRVGAVRSISLPDGRKAYHFSVCTDRFYTASNGTPCIDCTWHNVEMIEKRPDELDWISRGAWIHFTGYLHIMKYVGSDGVERCVTTIKGEDLLSIQGNGR